MKPDLTIFVPAYNEQGNLEQCIRILRSKAQELRLSVEFVIVNDGSSDSTGTIADTLSQRWPEVRVIHHSRNRGMGAAFQTARDAAAGEWFILIPADLALEPGELQHYFAAASQADIVVGLRSDRSDYTWARRIISWLNIRMIQTLFKMELHQFQYISMYRTELLQNIKVEYWGSAFFLAEILIKAKALGARLEEVSIKYLPRAAGKATGARFSQVVHTVVDMICFWVRWNTQPRGSLSHR